MKLKVNEVGAFAALSGAVKERITPFFDIARKEGLTLASFVASLQRNAKKVSKYLADDYPFYLDNFDIPDSLSSSGQTTYSLIIAEFGNTNFIPVIGLDRSPSHIAAVFSAKASGAIKSSRVALRLLEEEFTAFDVIESELTTMLADAGEAGFEQYDLILDCRVCRNVQPVQHASVLGDFIREAKASFNFSRIIVAGSSIPASIAEVAKVSKTEEIDRIELQIVAELRKQAGVEGFILGDYTIVSPMYSDVSMPPEILLNVTAPKVVYSHGDVHHIIRGGALRTHARGNFQYNDFAATLIGMPFYRGASYSYGDKFINDRSVPNGSKVTPGSILKPTINAHVTYMATDHPLAL